MLSFYMDHHVNIAIANGLRKRGIDVVTTFEDGMADVADEVLLSHVASLGRVLVTQDKGFHRICSRWNRSGREFPGIVFAVQESIDIGRTIEYLELVARVFSTEEIRNRIEYVPTS